MGRQAVAAIVVALATGCGGGGNDEVERAPEPVVATVATNPPQSDWAAKADAACVGYNEQIRAVRAATDPAHYEQELRNTIILARDELKNLESIRPVPRHQRTHIRNFLSAMRVRIVAMEELAQATEARDEARVAKALDREQEATRRAQRYRQPLNLTACGDERLR